MHLADAPHTVILGAGASIAAVEAANGGFSKTMPSMNNLTEVVGLSDLIAQLPETIRLKNFESLYSFLFNSQRYVDVRSRIEERIHGYFSSATLPDQPTIYDVLICSLSSKDIIATFNWDPFLYQAYCRTPKHFNKPRIVFLHGNVAIGYNKYSEEFGAVGMYTRSGFKLHPTQLLYPVENKDYNSDPFLRMQWDILRRAFAQSPLVTIFGYSAPITDAAATSLLSEAWGGTERRNMEQFEFIDIRSESELVDSWKGFIHSHHYEVVNDFFQSRVALYPRTTIESYRRQFLPLTLEEALAEPTNAVPRNFDSLQEMWDWYQPLLNTEKPAGDVT